MNDIQHRVLIAEDHDIARMGLRLTLEKMPGVAVIGEATDGDEALAITEQLRPSIILMDINLPGLSGIQATKLIKSTHPDIAIIMFTSDSSDETVFAALGAGADGYCLKNVSADELRSAIESVSRGAAWLNPGIAQRVLKSQVEARAQLETGKEKVLVAENPGQASVPGAPNQSKALLAQGDLEFLNLIQTGLKLDEIAADMGVSQTDVEEKLRTLLGSLTTDKANQPAITHSTLQSGASVRQTQTKIESGAVLSGRFKIENILGAGGISTVFKGKDLSMGRTVAIKMLQQQPLTEDKEVKRFMLEAKAASAISHPNVITIFDFGVTAQGQPFIVMDYIEGISFEELIKRQKPGLKRVLGILIQVCDAMTAAHKKGIIHRDIKPSNIMLVKTDDGTDFVKVVDFGMAKFISESEDLKLSKSSDLFGTPLYMSPEHFQGLKLDVRSDIYGLGCVLYEALTGSPPFLGNSLYDVMNKHLNEKPSMFPFLSPGKALSPELESLLLSMLAKDREQRPATMAEVKANLLQLKEA